ncbi:MAG TPA: hypothetical protein VJ184_08235 [Chryseolinea sp.]|nr:hypothetical protein [Chryseolinea sp.]
MEIADLSYTRLKETLTFISTHRNRESKEKLPIIPAISDAWSVVDNVSRLRGLITQTPGLKQKSEYVQLFLRKTSEIESFRNTIQHLNNDLNLFVEENLPVLGVLNWFTVLDKEKQLGCSCSIIAGTIFDHYVRMENPIGRFVKLPTGMVTLNVGEKSLSLCDTMEAVEKFIRNIEKKLWDRFKDLPQAGGDLVVCLDMDFSNWTIDEA